MAFDNDMVETISPVLMLIGQQAKLDLNWTSHMLEAVAGQTLPELYRHQRDAATDNAARICYGEKLASSAGSEPDDLIQLAHTLATEERLPEALHWIGKALDLRPEECELLRFKASILERMGRFEEALQTAQEAQSLGADFEAISDDIDRIRGKLVAFLELSIQSPEREISLHAYAMLLSMRKLSFRNFIGYLMRASRHFLKGAN